MTQQVLIVTLLSNDQTGIVQQVAHIVEQHGGNWLESRMAQLAGKFAGILTVSVEEKKADALINSLDGLSTSGIQVLIDKATDFVEKQCKLLTFEVVGADRIGIVSEVAQAFSQKGISIDDMETQCSSMPWSGEPLFEARGVLLAPLEMDTDQLLDQLGVIEDKLGVDITVSAKL